MATGTPVRAESSEIRDYHIPSRHRNLDHRARDQSITGEEPLTHRLEGYGNPAHEFPEILLSRTRGTNRAVDDQLPPYSIRRQRVIEGA